MIDKHIFRDAEELSNGLVTIHIDGEEKEVIHSGNIWEINDHYIYIRKNEDDKTNMRIIAMEYIKELEFTLDNNAFQE